MAVCETCRGLGTVMEKGATSWWRVPCPDCIGGVSHCCEGEQWSEREIEIEQVKK